MKVSGQKVAQHRAALVGAARRLLQERGFDGAGVADISREAGLTQGALYGQFRSKDELTAEACRNACADGAAAWSELGKNKRDVLTAYIDDYLSDKHLCDQGAGCIMAACVSEVGRQDQAVGVAFAEGFATMVALIQEALTKTVPRTAARRRALMLVSSLVGSVAMARALAVANPELSREIIAAAKKELKTLAVS